MDTAVLPAGCYVEANWGRWLVRCTRAFCFNALQVQPGQLAAGCLCGTVLGPLIWPADPEGIETLLLMRPDERTRNWLPGETLQDLVAENAVHGILPPGVEAGGVLIRTVDDRITGGAVAAALSSDIRRHAIERAN